MKIGPLLKGDHFWIWFNILHFHNFIFFRLQHFHQMICGSCSGNYWGLSCNQRWFKHLWCFRERFSSFLFCRFYLFLFPLIVMTLFHWHCRLNLSFLYGLRGGNLILSMNWIAWEKENILLYYWLKILGEAYE